MHDKPIGDDKSDHDQLNERIEKYEFGPITVQAAFGIINGDEIAWALRVDLISNDWIIRIGGRNALATAIIIAETLQRNRIRD